MVHTKPAAIPARYDLNRDGTGSIEIISLYSGTWHYDQHEAGSNEKCSWDEVMA